ncbi:MAG: hypothetical protein A2889_10415 [Nitrospinae bacterium RIFCSPLOWO2_01_FULL_39_10]|nr:MAG: hypothetical protein A2889_10415 [Nitrospinae bacterium RIFCSPLOWO2_01_FULL_39_10]
MKSHNSCIKCGSPVLSNKTIDCYGNTVVSEGCWNGHYEKMEIEGIESSSLERKIKETIPFVGFFTFQ